MAFSNYLKAALLDHILLNTAYTTPGTSIYVSLYVGDPQADDSGTEVAGGAYVRIQLTAWDQPVPGSRDNTSVVTFVTASGADWGLLTHIAIHDAVSAGNLLLFGSLDAPIQIDDGDQFKISSGGLVAALA